MRYFLELGYKGTAYHGWQIQNNAVSVQEIVNNGLSLILRQAISTIGSGRTDTGVHARQQFVHFDFPGELDTDQIIYKLNGIFPVDVVAYSLHRVNDEGHARFDAISRSYEYKIHKKRDPFLHNLSYLFPQPLQVQKMNNAAGLLLKHEDFESFSKVKTDANSFLCNITHAQWVEEGNNISFFISANRFLRGMVRAIVGTLLDVGTGKITVQEFEEIINKKNRSEAGRSVPPGGLYLTKVEYPPHYFGE